MKFPFQLIVVTVFIAVFIVAIIVFSGLLSPGGQNSSSSLGGGVEVWGTLPREQISDYLNDFNMSNSDYSVVYEHIPEADFYQSLIVALANNTQPDLVIFSSEIFAQIKDKLYITPFQAYSERTFRNTNIDGSQIFIDKAGVYAFPLVVDPLVVYYNRDILAAQNIISPPTTWTELVRIIPFVTKRTTQNVINQSTIAMGEADNISRYRDILSTLFLQTGNSIMSFDATTNLPVSTLSVGGDTESGQFPTAEALTFYTNFANTSNRSYSWHRAMPEALDYFLSGKSAFYIGRASELFTIQSRNPNLNFDVMEMFQRDEIIRPITFGSFTAVGVLRSAPNFSAAYTVAGLLSNTQGVDAISKKLSLPPARKDLLAFAQENPYVSIFFRAALASFTWFDPNFSSTNQIFRGMIQDVNSGRSNPSEAINEAARQLQGNR